MVPKKPKYKRVLLKISGEALAGGKGQGLDPEVLTSVARQIAEVSKMGVQLGVVVGGGNIFRGASRIGGDAIDSDREAHEAAESVTDTASDVHGVGLQKCTVRWFVDEDRRRFAVLKDRRRDRSTSKA